MSFEPSDANVGVEDVSLVLVARRGIYIIPGNHLSVPHHDHPAVAAAIGG